MAAPMIEAVFFIVENRLSGGQMVLAVKKLPERMKAHRDYTLYWGILNISDKLTKVSIDNFRKGVAGNPCNPLLGPLPKKVKVRPGKVAVIKAKVKHTALRGLYKYDIKVAGTTPGDPELEIDVP